MSSMAVAYYVWLALKQALPSLTPGNVVDIESAHLVLMGLAALIWVILFNYQGAYSYQRFTSFSTELKMIFKTVVLGTLALTLLMFLMRPGYIPRSLVWLFVVLNVLLLTGEKALLFSAAQAIRRRGLNRKTVLVVGTGDQTRRFVEAMEANLESGLDIIGFLDVGRESLGREVFGKPVLGSFDDIISVLHGYSLDEVIITVSTRRLGQIRHVLEACEREGVQVRIISDFLGSIAKKFRADVVYGLPVVSISYIPETTALAVKRGLDIILSTLALILLSPLLLLIALSIKFSSPGSVFYRWKVVGFNKKPFTSWKFRTMVEGADRLKDDLMHLNEMEGPVFKIKDDPRITLVGKFLRKYSLDELPQLWSVLKGDMSLVGPRPAGPHELVRYESWQRRKLSFKPGITCKWQVNGRNKISKFDDWVKMDLEYIDNWSLWLDLKIICKTIVTVLKGSGE